jgi:hypothetical protein
MRDNGLSAGSYDAAGEVDPQLAETVLRSLAEAGIAAYTKPSVGRDQLYVDATETERAREIVQRTTDDAVFAELVAHLEDGDAGDEHPWPAAEDVDPAPDDDEPTTIIVSSAVADADEAEEQRVRREAAHEPEHDHYVPPEPAPAPKLDWISRAAWTGLIGGPVVLVLAAVLDIGRGGRLLVFALLAFVAGFLTLVFRMKDRPPIDDTPDDGAVV